MNMKVNILDEELSDDFRNQVIYFYMIDSKKVVHYRNDNIDCFGIINDTTILGMCETVYSFSEEVDDFEFENREK